MSPSTYHQRLADEKRAAIVDAATRLFLELGYGGTSLARIATAADVSKATLFKQFPTKAALFDAIVTDYWKLAPGADQPPPVGDPHAGLVAIGRRYVALLTRPGMADLFRIVIAEAPRFPELGRTQFDLGKLPFFNTARDYLETEAAAGTMTVPDPTLAATQFLAMIADFVLWPRMLLLTWNPTPAAMHNTVEEAAQTMTARYAVK